MPETTRITCYFTKTDSIGRVCPLVVHRTTCRQLQALTIIGLHGVISQMQVPHRGLHVIMQHYLRDNFQQPFRALSAPLRSPSRILLKIPQVRYPNILNRILYGSLQPYILLSPTALCLRCTRLALLFWLCVSVCHMLALLSTPYSLLQHLFWL